MQAGHFQEYVPAMKYFLCAFLFSTTALAQYESDIQRGLLTQKFRSPGGITEECVMGQRFPDWPYSEAQNTKALKDEAKLCNIDFYDKGPGAISVRPKLNSTNPGVLFIGTNEKVLAKYKSSVSCSYTPSIISYYQISQMFGGVLKVPAATIRTVDFNTHKEIRQEALEMLKQLGLSEKLIGKTWRDSWGLAYKNPNSQRGQRVFTGDQKQIYGALVSNPRGEEKYKEIYGNRSSYDKRFEVMVSQRPYKLVTNPESLTRLVGTSTEQEGLQALVQMRDVSDMLVLDYILGQRDRPGNIHYYEMLYYSNDGVTWDKMKLANADKEGAHQSAKYQIPIKEMVLKDNDCGVVKGNMAREHGLLNGLRHMSPNTYRQVLQLAQAWETDSANVNDYVSREWLFTVSDIKSVKKDLLDLRDQLYRTCKSGELSLDLDLARHYSGSGPLPACEL